METEKLERGDVTTHEVGVVFKDGKGDYYTLSKDHEFVKSKLNCIYPRDFIIIDIGHELTLKSDYVSKIYSYIVEHAVWKKKYLGVSHGEHIVILDNVTTVMFNTKDNKDGNAVYMHFHNMKYFEDENFQHAIRGIEVETSILESTNRHVTSVNFLGCCLDEAKKLLVDINHKYSNIRFRTLTLLECKFYAYCEDDPIVFENLCGLISGNICSSVISNMRFVGNNVRISNSEFGYDKPKDETPYNCVFNTTHNALGEEGGNFKLCLCNSVLWLKNDIEFYCDVKLVNIRITEFACADDAVYSYHKLDFFLPNDVDKQYRHNIVGTQDIVADVFSTHINLYVDEFTGIAPHNVTVTIEDNLRVSMKDKNSHLFFRAYVDYGAGRERDIYIH